MALGSFDSFRLVAQRFGIVGGLAVGGTTLLPLVAGSADLQPFWFPGISFVCTLIMLVTLIAVYQAMSGRSRRATTMVLFVFLLPFLVSLSAYIYLYSNFVTVDIDNNPITLGCEWTEEAKIIASEDGQINPDQCPGRYQVILEELQHNVYEVWTPKSLQNIRMMMVASWVALFFSLAGTIAVFVVGLTRPNETLAADRPGDDVAENGAEDPADDFGGDHAGQGDD